MYLFSNRNYLLIETVEDKMCIMTEHVCQETAPRYISAKILLIFIISVFQGVVIMIHFVIQCHCLAHKAPVAKTRKEQ